MIDPQSNLIKFNHLDWNALSFDDAVQAAKDATAHRNELANLLDMRYGEYIARLSRSEAVVRGGLQAWCLTADLNYATVRNWRSKYLDAGDKRGYERIVIADDNSPKTFEEIVADGIAYEVAYAREMALLHLEMGEFDEATAFMTYSRKQAAHLKRHIRTGGAE